MKELESLAKQSFERYCLKTSGRVSNWGYVSKDRKLEWMKEALLHMRYALNHLRENLKQPPPPGKTETTYGLGYIDGIRAKHYEYKNSLDVLEQKLDQQLQETISSQD
jgi:hypothetical protein